MKNHLTVWSQCVQPLHYLLLLSAFFVTVCESFPNHVSSSCTTQSFLEPSKSRLDSPSPFVPFIFRGSAISSSSRRRVDRTDREFLGSVSSRGASDLFEFSVGPNSSSPLTMSTEDLSIVTSRSLSPKRNLNATTTSGLADQTNEQPART